MTKISRQLAHRATDDGVYISSITREHDIYHLTARWPDAAYYDLFSFAEIMRQMGNVIAHLELDVPLESYGKPNGYRFLMNDPFLRLINGVSLPVAGSGPLSLTVTYPDLEFGSDVSILRKAHFRIKLWCGEVEFALGSGSLICLPINVYDRLQPKPPIRESLTLTPLDPAIVGRVNAADVLLYENGLAMVDLENTVFIDHPLPHLPGIVLLEMFRQAAWTTMNANQRIIGLEGEFYALVHPDSVLRYSAQKSENVISIQLHDKDMALLANGSVYVGH